MILRKCKLDHKGSCRAGFYELGTKHSIFSGGGGGGVRQQIYLFAHPMPALFQIFRSCKLVFFCRDRGATLRLGGGGGGHH